MKIINLLILLFIAIHPIIVIADSEEPVYFDIFERLKSQLIWESPDDFYHNTSIFFNVTSGAVYLVYRTDNSDTGIEESLLSEGTHNLTQIASRMKIKIREPINKSTGYYTIFDHGPIEGSRIIPEGVLFGINYWFEGLFVLIPVWIVIRKIRKREVKSRK
ncbi:MAG: hypothetical protein HeimC3_41350 [Candidatus Heimdallarchaeota archaeon LC_3]|nr:MAG: hypothetical protein HeimC3_41350 [Candidatus Heimdallarchaeota archaeon LC_3]